MTEPRRHVVEVTDQRLVPLAPDEVWELLADTDHLNAAVGLPAVTYGTPLAGGEGLYREARALLKGWIRLRWEEQAFEWVRPEQYTVRRIFSQGPFHEFRGGVELAPVTGGTLVQVKAALAPKGIAGALLARAAGRDGVKRTLDYCVACAQAKQARRLVVLPGPKPAHVERERIARSLTQIRTEGGVPAELIEALGRHLREASDDEVGGMRPFELAVRWGRDRLEMLRLFLRATRRGLLELEWDLMCPNCRVPKASARTLRELDPEFHCDLCGITYEADFDRYVELRFTAHPAVRKAKREVFCIGGPMSTPHILAQQTLAPGEARDVLLPFPPEPLRWRVLRENRTLELEPMGAEPGTVFEFDGSDWRADGTGFTPGTLRVNLRNSSDRTVVAVLEKVEWDPLAVTAAAVTTMQEFRAAFGSEVLAPGRQISVRHLCFLFTDVRDSTALYEQVGDAPAFGRVRRHFDYLEEHIRANGGGVVKTIGDAVMAVFPTAGAGFAAAMAIQRGLGGFNARFNLEPPVVLKAGVHAGPVIAVNANGQLDYFGRTVNLAARIQGTSAGGDIVMESEMVREPEVQAALAGAEFQFEVFDRELKGLSGPFRLCRIVPVAAGPAD